MSKINGLCAVLPRQSLTDLLLSAVDGMSLALVVHCAFAEDIGCGPPPALCSHGFTGGVARSLEHFLSGVY